jgi:hypothetical protein
MPQKIFRIEDIGVAKTIAIPQNPHSQNASWHPLRLCAFARNFFAADSQI